MVCVYLGGELDNLAQGLLVLLFRPRWFYVLVEEEDGDEGVVVVLRRTWRKWPMRHGDGVLHCDLEFGHLAVHQ